MEKEAPSFMVGHKHNLSDRQQQGGPAMSQALYGSSSRQPEAGPVLSYCVEQELRPRMWLRQPSD